MIRAVKLSLKFCTASKLAKIRQLLSEQVPLINGFVHHIWHHGGALDKRTFDAVPVGRVSQRFKASALYQALGIVKATRESARALGKKASCPVFNRGVILDAKTFTVLPGTGAFNYMGKLSTLTSRQPILLPLKATRVLNRWLSLPGAKLKNGCTLFGDHLIVWVEVPELAAKPVAAGRVLGVDLGVNKLIATSEGQFIGREMRAVKDRVRRAKPGSAGRRRASVTRTNFINRCCKQLPWAKLSLIGIEDLIGIKIGKQKGRSKQFRKSMAPWTVRQAVARIRQLAQENRVHLVSVDPAYTSRTCPTCGHCTKENRRGENFCCVGCGHSADADLVGATNVLIRTRATLGSLDSPSAIKSLANHKMVLLS